MAVHFLGFLDPAYGNVKQTNSREGHFNIVGLGDVSTYHSIIAWCQALSGFLGLVCFCFKPPDLSPVAFLACCLGCLQAIGSDY